VSKGSNRRPSQISKEEELIRWKLAFGEMTFDEYEVQYKKLQKQGKIYRG